MAPRDEGRDVRHLSLREGRADVPHQGKRLSLVAGAGFDLRPPGYEPTSCQLLHRRSVIWRLRRGLHRSKGWEAYGPRSWGSRTRSRRSPSNCRSRAESRSAWVFHPAVEADTAFAADDSSIFCGRHDQTNADAMPGSGPRSRLSFAVSRRNSPMAAAFRRSRSTSVTTQRRGAGRPEDFQLRGASASLRVRSEGSSSRAVDACSVSVDGRTWRW